MTSNTSVVFWPLSTTATTLAVLVVVAVLGPVARGQGPDVPFPDCPEGQEVLYQVDWDGLDKGDGDIELAVSEDQVSEFAGGSAALAGFNCPADGSLQLSWSGLPSLSAMSYYYQLVARGPWEESYGASDMLVVAHGASEDSLTTVLETDFSPLQPTCYPEAAPCDTPTAFAARSPATEGVHATWFGNGTGANALALLERWGEVEKVEDGTWVVAVGGSEGSDGCPDESTGVAKVMLCGTKAWSWASMERILMGVLMVVMIGKGVSGYVRAKQKREEMEAERALYASMEARRQEGMKQAGQDGVLAGDGEKNGGEGRGGDGTGVYLAAAEELKAS